MSYIISKCMYLLKEIYFEKKHRNFTKSDACNQHGIEFPVTCGDIRHQFFLSPYIIKTVGVEAYGFVGLANNFIS